MISINLLIILPLVIPLGTAVLCLLMTKLQRAQRWISCLGAFGLLISGTALISSVYQTRIQCLQIGNWPAPFGITLVADLFACVMVAITGLIGFVVTCYSLSGIDLNRERLGFHPLLHVLLLGVTGAFLTGDLFNLYVWFEVMLVASFVLTALGGERQQLEGAFKYVTLNLIASALFLASVGLLYASMGTLNIADLARRIPMVDSTIPQLTASVLMVAFGMKAAVFPLFFWLPASYHTPPPVISAVMAGLLTKVGVYALVRLFCLIFASDFESFQPLLLWAAGFTMVVGVLGAAAQNEIRRILSFHIISQIGYMILGLAIFTPLALTGMVFYLIHHIIVKTNLFLIAGVISRSEGEKPLAEIGGLYQARPWLAVCFLIPALSLAGLPPLSGFWAKFALMKAGLDASYFVLVGTALLVSLLTLYSMSKIWQEAFWKASPSREVSVKDAVDRETCVGWMMAPCVVLACVTLALGVATEPALNLAREAADQLMQPSQYISAVFPEN